MSSLRIDRAELGAVTRTESGGLRVPATLTRPGVLRYLQPDGSIRREYLPPEEVFAPAYLASLAYVPVTRDHPPTLRVDADSWREWSVGHAAETVTHDEHFVMADLFINDGPMIRDVQARKITEVSIGRTQDYVPSPGVTPDGEAYDGKQTNLRANHIALVPRGRAGRDVRLRLDADDNEVADPHATVTGMTKIKIGSKEYDAGSPEAVAALEALQASAARADAADAELAKLRKRALEDLKAKAKEHGAEFRADADASEVMIATVKKIAPGVSLEGQSEDYVAGAFAVAIAMALDLNDTESTGDEPEPADAPPPAAGAAAARADAVDSRVKTPARQTRNALNDVESADEVARRKMLERGRALGKI